MEKGNGSSDVSVAGKAAISKEDAGVVTEDGELPSLIPVAAVATDYKYTVLKPESDLDHSERTALISKTIIPPAKTARSHSFGRHHDDSDLFLDIESEADDISKTEVENEVIATEGRSWVDYGSQEFNLGLIRRSDAEERSVELVAKVTNMDPFVLPILLIYLYADQFCFMFALVMQIKISMEYPVRPPLFSLSVLSPTSGGNSASFSQSDWFNELHAMEAEVGNKHFEQDLWPIYVNFALDICLY